MKIQLHITIILICIFALTGYSQEETLVDTNLYLLEGRIVDKDDMSSMYLVHIMNLDERTGTISKIDGRFRIFVRVGDTILMSSVGYEKYRFSVTPDILAYENGIMINLKSQPIIMDEVVILGKTFAQFREEFIALKVKPIEINEIYLESLHAELQLNGPATPRGFKGPITFLYENFNKSARLQRALKRNRRLYGNPSDYLDYPIKVNYFNDVEHQVNIQ